MTSKRTYFVDSKEVAIGVTTAVPALYGATVSTADCSIVGIRVSCEATSSPTPPSNGSILAALNIVTGTVGGGASVTANNNGPSTLAANTTFKSGSTALTGLTQSTELWSHPIAFAAGASWGEWFPEGFERNIPVSTFFGVYFTAASGDGSGFAFKVTLEFAE
jgi:hypothetical protein